MGQYWKVVNLDKREWIDPHKLGTGLKLWEQLANHPGTGSALIVLLAAMPEQRGGGDLQEDPIIGRWVGDRVVFAGDYAEDTDFPDSPVPFGMVYSMCTDREGWNDNLDHWMKNYPDVFQRAMAENWQPFTDITDDVARVIECELDGKFTGTGWRAFEQNTA